VGLTWLTGLLVVVAGGGPVWGQGAAGPGVPAGSTVVPKAQLDELATAVAAANEKLDNVQAQMGGRYTFFLAGDKGQYLVRVDRVKGELAFLNTTGQPKWLTLALPEMPVDARNSFYQTYVNALANLRPL
jgi:hypothetical protein